jgi:hypothetical protein
MYLAGTVFDNDVTVFTDGTGLLRVSFGGTGIGLGFEMVLFVRHGWELVVAVAVAVAVAVTEKSGE